MFDTIEDIDRQLFLTLNNVHQPWLDVVMWYVSKTLTWLPVFIFFCWYAIKKRGWKFMLLLLLSCGISVAATDLISKYGFKETVQRYRPTHNLEIGHQVKTVISPDGEEYRGGQYGFVSSHAANFAGVVLILFLYFRHYSRWWFMLFIWFAVIAYSRIYLGVHYPSDLIAGAILGMTVGYLIYLALQRITKSHSATAA